MNSNFKFSKKPKSEAQVCQPASKTDQLAAPNIDQGKGCWEGLLGSVDAGTVSCGS